MPKKNHSSHRFKGTHYIPPPSKKRGPSKGAVYRDTLAKIDAARLAMEREHMKALARAHCDQAFAREHPELVAMIATLNADMHAKLKRLYYAAKT